MTFRSLFAASAAAVAIFFGSSQQASAVLVNASLGGKSTSQSTTLGAGFAASLGADGNRSGSSFTHTTGEATDNWWQIDLGATMPISAVDIFNRTSCCSGRLRDITIEFRDFNGNVVATSPVLNPSNILGGGAGNYSDGPGSEASSAVPHLEFDPFAPVLARSVRIVRDATGGAGSHDANALQLAEVEIFADNLAQGKPATQTSTHGAGPVGNAVNGNLGDFSHTLNSNPNPSLTVDLLDTYNIDSIILHNRDSCCGGRLRDITVDVLAADGVTVVATSGLLNAGNSVFGGSFTTGPAFLAVDLEQLFANEVLGRYVRVSRASLPGGGDDNTILSLGELQVFGSAAVLPEPMTALLGLMSLAGLASRTGRRARA